MKGTIRSIVMSALLAATGLVMLFGTDSLPKAQAQVTKQYQSNWTATDLYRVKFTNTSNGVVFYGPQIGVAKWAVGGSIDNGRTTYTETWDGPSAQYINFAGSATGCPSTVDKTKWLAGCFLSNGSGVAKTVDLEKIPLNVASDQNCTGATTYPVSGITAACKQGFGASYTDGAYAFNFSTTTTRPANANDLLSQFPAHYTAIPLQWQVTGTITYN
jgi:hypothetical protein